MHESDVVPEAEPREHHIHFAHRILPTLVWGGAGALSYLAGPDSEQVMRGLWVRSGEDFPETDRVAVDGLSHEWRRFGDDHTVLFVELPTAQEPSEAIYVAVALSPEVRVITCELPDPPTDNRSTSSLGEWKRDASYLEHGHLSATSSSQFLTAVAALLGVPVGDVIIPSSPPVHELVQEAPTLAYFDAETEARVDALGLEAEEAQTQKDWPRYEQCSRALHALFLEHAGAADGDTMMFHCDVVSALLQQGKAIEAEPRALDVWALCRRHRLPAHRETDQALRLLARARLAQGDDRTAEHLMRYRIDVAECLRGSDDDVTRAARAEYDEQFGTAP